MVLQESDHPNLRKPSPIREESGDKPNLLGETSDMSRHVLSAYVLNLHMRLIWLDERLQEVDPSCHIVHIQSYLCPTLP